MDLCLEGEHPVFMNLPGIKINNINDHVILSISDVIVIDHVLGLGGPVQWLQDLVGAHNYNGINGNKRKQEMLDLVLSLS